MKKLFTFILFISASATVFAQKYVPKLKAGSVIDYAVDFHGQAVPLSLTVKTLGAEGLTFQWEVDNYGSGTFEMSGKALQNATASTTAQPSPGVATKLSDNETFCIISKSALENLAKNKSFDYNGIKYTNKADATAYKLNGKEADVFRVVSTDGKQEMWILNNPDLPLICQTKGSTDGVDVSVVSIKE